MAERSKSYLKQEFKAGERPSEIDFGDLIDSFVTKIDDAVNLDSNSNLNIPGGVNLGNPANGTAGTLRFNAGNVQVFDGGTWNNVGGGGGAFLPVGGGPNVAFGGGNVGIGAMPAVNYKLEVDLGNNTATGDRARFGNAVLANGNGVFASSAQFSHADHSANNSNFALRQSAAGDVIINAPTNQPISITHNRLTTRVFIAPSGQVVIGNNALLPGANANNLLQVNADAGKTLNGNVWAVISDGRYKKDIREFNDGLEKLMKVRPVKFKYDGIPVEAPADHEEVGIIGQEMQEIFPYMISNAALNKMTPSDKKDEVLVYNGNALTYVMVNAIQELAAKVKALEAQLEEAKKKPEA